MWASKQKVKATLYMSSFHISVTCYKFYEPKWEKLKDLTQSDDNIQY